MDAIYFCIVIDTITIDNIAYTSGDVVVLSRINDDFLIKNTAVIRINGSLINYLINNKSVTFFNEQRVVDNEVIVAIRDQGESSPLLEAILTDSANNDVQLLCIYFLLKQGQAAKIIDYFSASLSSRVADLILQYGAASASRQVIADKLFVSTSSLKKKLTQENTCFIKIKRKVCDNLAKELLDRGQSVSQVAYTCGYNNSSYFTYVFKEENGCTPLQYKKRLSTQSY